MLLSRWLIPVVGSLPTICRGFLTGFIGRTRRALARLGGRGWGWRSPRCWSMPTVGTWRLRVRLGWGHRRQSPCRWWTIGRRGWAEGWGGWRRICRIRRRGSRGHGPAGCHSVRFGRGDSVDGRWFGGKTPAGAALWFVRGDTSLEEGWFREMTRVFDGRRTTPCGSAFCVGAVWGRYTVTLIA
jgi:hypothetical protein